MKKYLIFGIVMAMFVESWAQSVRFEASLSATTVRLGEHLVYQLTITADEMGQLPSPILPEFSPHFSLVSTGESTQISMANGAMSRQVIKRYRLNPLQLGKIQLEPAKITIDGATYETQSVVIDIVSGSQTDSNSPISTQKNRSVRVESQVTKHRLFVGEPMVWTVSLLRQQVQFWDRPVFDIPQLEGVIVESLPTPDRPEVRSVQGQQYYAYVKQKHRIIPLSAGKIDIPSVRMGVVLNPFEGQRVVESEPVQIEVRPLPAFREEGDFYNVVGEFKMTQSPISETARQGEPITIQFRIMGTGNMQNLTELSVDSTPDFKVYKSDISDEARADSPMQIRQIQYIVIPKKAGIQQVPAFGFWAFSPRTERYYLVQSADPSIRVEATTSVTSSATGIAPIKQDDIRYLKGYKPPPIPHIRAKAIRLGVGLNIGLGLVWVFLQIRHRWRRRRSVRYRLMSLSKQVKTYLKSSDPDTLQLAYQCLLELGGLIVGESIQGMPAPQIKEKLVEAKVSDDLVDQFLKSIDRLSAGLFAPKDQATGLPKAEVDAMVAMINRLVKGGLS